MLLPAQVIPFLGHDDEAVRTHAADYLSDAHDPSPATADDFWGAIDRFGIARSLSLVSRLCDLPQTSGSLDRLLAALRSQDLDEDTNYHLQRALDRLDFPLLTQRKDELLSDEKVLPRVRNDLAGRLELADRPAGELWEMLAQHSEDVDDKAVGEFDVGVSERLVEALARHGDAVGARALDRLRDGPADDWMEIFCVQLLGELRYAPATAALVDRFLIDAELLRENVARALTRIGAAEVVERIEAFYPGKPWHVRLYAHGPLGRIKRAESEQALLRLLAEEVDDEQRTWLATALCDLCSREALAAVCRMVVKHRYDPQIVDLDEMLLTVATMTGYEFREAAEVRDRVERRRRKRGARGHAGVGPVAAAASGAVAFGPAAAAAGGGRRGPAGGWSRRLPAAGRRRQLGVGAGAAARRVKGGAERPLPLRQRQEVQEVLPGRRAHVSRGLRSA